MTYRTNVSAVPLPVRRSDDTIEITYLDDRVVTYPGPFQDEGTSLTANRTVEIHVLIVDNEFSEGMMIYLNDYDTVDDILESTGVGRIILDDGATESLYPGVRGSRQGERITVEVDTNAETAGVYVFVESQLKQDAYELQSVTAASER